MENEKKKLTDEELVFLAKHHTVDPYDELMQRYNKLVASYLRKYFIDNYDEQDMLQEARLVLVKVVQKFDPTLQVSFGQYFKTALKNRYGHLVRYALAQKRKPTFKHISTDAMADQETLDYYYYRVAENPAFLTNLYIKDQMKSLSGLLSPLEKKVFEAYLQTPDYKKIATSLGLPESKVKNALDRCKKKIKDLIQ